ncbi:YjbE family integral membrane protein [Alkalibacillus flavidus]|uniref:YjbE family integral membrane protein n=1 Tax=Alkalibacillus flavidus TaxID=546021 RepID=A0ABV2KUX0_9BACI
MEFLLEFNWDLIKAIIIIIGIDLILGSDNAIVIAMASRKLPANLQQKAIFLGTVLAIASRFILATIALFLLTMPYVQLIGGLLLFYIAIQLLREQDAHDPTVQSSSTLLGAVKTIIIADVVMSFDNVLAISAAANNNMYLILFGLIVSVPLIIFGSKLILRAMQRFPSIIYIGAMLLAYTSAELMLKEDKLQTIWTNVPYNSLIWPAFIMLVTLMIGFVSRHRHI